MHDPTVTPRGSEEPGALPPAFQDVSNLRRQAAALERRAAALADSGGKQQRAALLAYRVGIRQLRELIDAREATLACRGGVDAPQG